MSDYFWSQVDTNTIDGCWRWRGGSIDGYGTYRHHGHKWAAHRLAYVLCWGAIPEGKQLDHRCFNTLCVSPWHLEAVTLEENVRRAKLRGHTGSYRNPNRLPTRTARETAVEVWKASFKPGFVVR